MATPLVSSNPKLGTSLGAIGGIHYYFDEQSRVSILGLSAQYSSTDSYKVALSAKTSFGADRHRAKLSLSGGRILNDYQDYLGTGVELKNVETAWGVGGNYLYRLGGNWFAGAQAMFKNYQVIGQTPSDEENLALLGITGLRSGGVGAVVQNDARDSDNRPTRGWLVNADTFAFREALGGDYDYDVYRFDLRGYWGQRGGHVLAVRQNNQWTVDAPLEAESSISLRGYKSGQYLGRHVSSVEVEERFSLAKRWGATVFAGLGCLYGDGEGCTEGDNLYPAAGAGIQFVLVPKEGIVGNLEIGRGKNDNSGVYLRVGYAF
jgi:outer membrane protein assembly factor BamA